MYNRREILRIGAAGCVSLPQLLKAQAQTPAKATSVVQIYLPGGISHQDSWDYKVNGSPEYRGPFAPVKTKIDGVHFGELLKETAKVSDNLTVIRSMTHGEAAHERGTHNMLTGYRPSPALNYPSFGSVISHELGNRNNLPAYVLVPNQFAPENGTGYLSTKYGPFALGSNPEDPGFVVKDLNTPKGVSDKQLDRRRALLGAVDDYFKTRESNVDAVKAMGINVPIIPGIKPITTKKQLSVLPKIFHIDIPEILTNEIEKCKDDKAVKEVGIEWAIQQSKELKAAGTPVLHYYTMGLAETTRKIASEVF